MHAPLSADVPVLLLNQPIIVSEQSTHFGWSLTGGSIVVERLVVKYFVGNFWFISCSHLTFHSYLDSLLWSVCRSRLIGICIDRFLKSVKYLSA